MKNTITNPSRLYLLTLDKDQREILAEKIRGVLGKKPHEFHIRLVALGYRTPPTQKLIAWELVDNNIKVADFVSELENNFHDKQIVSPRKRKSRGVHAKKSK